MIIPQPNIQKNNIGIIFSHKNNRFFFNKLKLFILFECLFRRTCVSKLRVQIYDNSGVKIFYHNVKVEIDSANLPIFSSQ